MTRLAGIDTNVLVRFMVEDEPDQAGRARNLLSDLTRVGPVVVNGIVLVELFWILRSTLKLARAEIVDKLRVLLESDDVAVVEAQAARAALQDYEAGLGDFSDRLIARINEAHGASTTYTFDQRAARHPPLALVP
ncbi:PIN domain-containing protein [Salinarimonas sp.]|uniref:PIN domain-containing protein n=1 Tax=Salinarimonas sp. TaxID=2766526 RepID=UPI00391A65DB